MSRKDRNSRARKERNRQYRESLPGLSPRPSGVPRPTFFGKSRKGDEASLDFTFSGVAVPLSEENPTEGLLEKTVIQRALWEGLPDAGEDPH